VAIVICGVDVSSIALDARIGRDGAHQQFENSATGIAALIAFCRHHQAELVVMEASGGYERRPFALLWAGKIGAAIVSPREVRRFAQAMGRLEKTDRIDAGMIAWYAATKHIVACEPASQTQQRLAAHVTRLRQLVELRVSQLNQCRLVTDQTVSSGCTELLALITRQIRALEAVIVAAIAADPLWQALDQALRSIKGVAGRTIARLLAELPEIGQLDHKAISKLAGLAPIACDSGKHRGKRAIRGGRATVRSILFVVAELVRRYDPDFAAFHRRLSEAGKPKKVVRVALAHKLLVRLNAKARQVRQAFAEHNA
jgi:transposase